MRTNPARGKEVGLKTAYRRGFEPVPFYLTQSQSHEDAVVVLVRYRTPRVPPGLVSQAWDALFSRAVPDFL
ncbi:hypothetical protein ABK905_25730 [Acerihabitans sp. KWT182]|uniref:Uncharacterized protein n=1 Tax=Acerihabitans sp. KWT182 TaxID=3157919 RepID=A0AAU7Q9L1_9GAMM